MVLNGTCLQYSLMGKMKVCFRDSDLSYKCVLSGRFDCCYKYSYITNAPTSRARLGCDHMIHVQSVPITTKFVGSNPVHREVYSGFLQQ